MRKSSRNLKKFSFASVLLPIFLTLLTFSNPSQAFAANINVAGTWTIDTTKDAALIVNVEKKFVSRLTGEIKIDKYNETWSTNELGALFDNVTQATNGAIAASKTINGPSGNSTTAINGKVTNDKIVFTESVLTVIPVGSLGQITIKLAASCSGTIVPGILPAIKSINYTYGGTYYYYAETHTGSYDLYITKNGNFANKNASVSVINTTSLDTIIDSGPSGTIHTQNVTFTWHGKAGEGGDVVGYYYMLDSGAKYTTATTMAFKNLSLGSHFFMVFAKDKANNLDLSPALAQFTITKANKLDPPDEFYYGEQEGCVGDPVNVVNGNMYVTTTDLKLPGRNLGFEFTRAYNGNSKTSSALGYGWTHSYNIYLTQDTVNSTAKIIAEEGRGYIFTDNGDGTYLTQRGDYSALTKTKNSFIWSKKDGKQYIFDLSGKLLQIKDRNGNTISFIYDGQNKLTQIADTAGRLINLSYNSQNLLTRITDPSGRNFDYTYDSSSNLISVTDPQGNTSTYKYDNNHNITQKTNAKDESVYFTYDSLGRCTSSALENNVNYCRLDFDTANSKTTVTDSKGNQNTYYYNSDYLITRITNPQGKDTTSTWDTNFNLISKTDELGRTTQMSYDANGNLTKATDALGKSTTFTYEIVFNQITSSIDALGNKTTYTYDKFGNLTKTTYPDGSTTSFTYSVYGLPITSTNQLGKVTNFGYDTQGNLTITRDPLKAITYFTYDSIGNLTQTQDALKNVTKFNYDALNQLTQVTYPDGSTVSYGYDAVGNRTSVTDQNSNTTTYTYNQNHKITSSTDALGKTINYTYDTEGNLTNVADQNNNQTSFGYDSLNRQTFKTDAFGNKTQYTYDAVGNLTSKTDPKNQITSYVYDSLNRLTKTTYPENAVSYTYDSLGRRLTMIDSQGTTYYTYDKLGRLLSTDGPLATDTITYTYDKAGNRLTLTDPDKKVTKYTYDANKHILTIVDPQSKTTKYAYDLLGNVTTLTYPNNTKATYTYDSLNHLTKLINSLTVKPNTVINQFSYTYDLTGRRTKATLLDGSISYAYDKRGELTQENRTSASLTYAISYTYDATGNRLSMAKNGQNTTYTYNSLNQLTREQNPTSGQITYAYDANGNLISKLESGNTTKLTFDSKNQLTSFTSPSVNQTYTYDGEGRRIALTTSSATTTNLYDGLNVIKESSSLGTTSFIRNPGAPGGIGGILKGISSKGTSSDRYYHYDSLGSVTNLTSSTGSSAQAYGYDAFGNVVTQSGSSTNDNKFLTKETDASGLVYFGARYYDPRIGRFITEDPSGMSDGPNLYIYCKNDPVNWVDRWGLRTDENQYWPDWINKLDLMNYGNYCGPYNTDQTFRTKPIDQMDQDCMLHDISRRGSYAGTADVELLLNLAQLPLNPNKWNPPAQNIISATKYRMIIQTYFTIRTLYLIEKAIIKGMLSWYSTEVNRGECKK